MKIKLKGELNVYELFEKHGTLGLSLVNVAVGYDGKLYFLFSSGVPKRISDDRGSFVNTKADAEYTAVVVTPDWKTGEILETARLNLGRHAMNFHFLRPYPNDIFLLLGARCRYHGEDGEPEKNGVIVDAEGEVIDERCFGDGIRDCVVREDGTIFVSYFDEGIFGNYGWDDPIGYSGVCAFDEEAEVIWRADDDICDCYAMYLEDNGDIWYYYYSDFKLVRGNPSKLWYGKSFDPGISGARFIAVCGNGCKLVINGGYYARREHYMAFTFDGDDLKSEGEVEFTAESGNVPPVNFITGCASKAIAQTQDDLIRFLDFSELN